jgi:hypothetical protein
MSKQLVTFLSKQLT